MSSSSFDDAMLSGSLIMLPDDPDMEELILGSSEEVISSGVAGISGDESRDAGKISPSLDLSFGSSKFLTCSSPSPDLQIFEQRRSHHKKPALLEFNSKTKGKKSKNILSSILPNSLHSENSSTNFGSPSKWEAKSVNVKTSDGEFLTTAWTTSDGFIKRSGNQFLLNRVFFCR